MMESPLFELNPNPMLIYDLDTLNILDVNEAALKKYRYSRREFKGLTIRDIRPEDEIDMLHDTLDNMEGGLQENRNMRHMGKGGEQFYVQVNSHSYSYDGYENARLVVVHDITREVEARKQVEDAYGELNRLIRNNPLAMIKWDENFRVLEWSDRAEQISGFSGKELLGKQLFELQVFDSGVKKLISEQITSMREGGIPGILDTYIYSKQGERIDIRIHASSMHDRDRHLKSVLTFVEDISETKRAERKLTRQNALIKFVNHLSQSIYTLDNEQKVLEMVVGEICRFTEWPVGHVYRSAGEGRFVSTDIWYLETPDRHKTIVDRSLETFFSKGKGFLGRVIEKGQPLWMQNIDEAPGFLRNSGTDDRELNLKTVFAFPVKVHDTVSAVLEFFHEQPMAADPVFMELVGSIENPLGRILERVQAKKQIQRSEQKYRRLFEKANDGIFIMKGNRFVDCNTRIEEIFECDKSEIVGKTPSHFSPRLQPDGLESSEKAERYLSRALGGDPQVFDWKHKSAEGRLIDAEVSLNKLELEEGDFLQAIVRDKTRQKQAENDLRRSEELFRNLFLRAPVAILMVDSDNKVKMVNRAFESLFGYTMERLAGKNPDHFLNGGDRRKQGNRSEAEGDLPEADPTDFTSRQVIREVTTLTSDGRDIDVLVASIPVFLEDELFAGFRIYVNITPQKNYQRKLQASLHEKEVLLKEIHHRVKNNLAVISALLELQVLQVDDNSVTHVLKDGLLRIKSMALVHETLYKTEDFSRLEFSNYIENLIRLNSEVLEETRQEIKIRYDIENIDLNINQAVPCALIMNEMVSNAYKYAFEDSSGGTLWIRIFKKEGDEVHLCVEDDGVGLPENFEELRSESLGMTVIEQLTKQLNGELIITSRNGAKFELIFKKEDRRGTSNHFFR